MKSISFFIHRLIVSGSLLLYLSCSTATEKLKTELFINNNSLFMEIEQSDSLMICWDPPKIAADSVDSYELGYRASNDSSWKIIKTLIPTGDTPHVIVHRNEIISNDSIFYFAVRSVAKGGFKSDFHASSDLTAGPTGWYVFWK